jgi:hypothetical protein
MFFPQKTSERKISPVAAHSGLLKNRAGDAAAEGTVR